MELNSNILKVSGKVELEPNINLHNGDEVTVTVTGNVVQVSENDNQDGTFDRVFKVKPITGKIS